MPLLLVPLLLLAVVALWACLLPLALLNRYRRGRARRRAVAWVVGGNAWLLGAGALLFLVGALVVGAWRPLAPVEALAGLLAGMLLGWLGLRLTRFEATPTGLLYTANRWLVLALTVMVAARLALALWQGWHLWQADAATGQWLDAQAGLLLAGGLLLGHYLAYTWGLRHRLRHGWVR
ncbi:DUF1453 domain-containing protein [Lysobacter sp. A3-1-A15]|uniref:DUF1453 domain-containing protein n=1 Tax=Novilysobacter viscosus TaxID=3098602 RepID=UPI002ED953C1